MRNLIILIFTFVLVGCLPVEDEITLQENQVQFSSTVLHHQINSENVLSATYVVELVEPLTIDDLSYIAIIKPEGSLVVIHDVENGINGQINDDAGFYFRGVDSESAPSLPVSGYSLIVEDTVGNSIEKTVTLSLPEGSSEQSESIYALDPLSGGDYVVALSIPRLNSFGSERVEMFYGEARVDGIIFEFLDVDEELICTTYENSENTRIYSPTSWREFELVYDFRNPVCSMAGVRNLVVKIDDNSSNSVFMAETEVILIEQ